MLEGNAENEYAGSQTLQISASSNYRIFRILLSRKESVVKVNAALHSLILESKVVEIILLSLKNPSYFLYHSLENPLEFC